MRVSLFPLTPPSLAGGGWGGKSICEIENPLHQTVGGDFAIALLDLDPDCSAASVFRRTERRAAAHEGVEDRLALWEHRQNP